MHPSKQFALLISISSLVAGATACSAAERLGIGIKDLKSGKASYQHGETSFPLQSVFKAPLAMAVLKTVDEGRLKLDQPVTVHRSDIALNWTPLGKAFRGESEEHTVQDLLEQAVENSDNTAGDLLMKLVGGPKAVTAALTAAGISGMRVDRYERQLQPEILGLPPYGLDETIDTEDYKRRTAALPAATKRKAVNYYLYKDRRDSSTPQAAISFLSKLYNGELLSPSSTQLLLKMMSDAKTGQHRLIAGLPQGSKLAHKTGTGDTVLGVNVATNDMGIATLPDGRVVAIVVFLSGSSRSEADRDRMIREVAHRVSTKSGGM